MVAQNKTLLLMNTAVAATDKVSREAILSTPCGNRPTKGATGTKPASSSRRARCWRVPQKPDGSGLESENNLLILPLNGLLGLGMLLIAKFLSDSEKLG